MDFDKAFDKLVAHAISMGQAIDRGADTHGRKYAGEVRAKYEKELARLARRVRRLAGKPSGD